MKARSRDLAFITAFLVKLTNKYVNTILFPKFRWQSSFHDHITRDDADYLQHVHYSQ